MDSHILSVWVTVEITDALRAFSIVSFFDRIYESRLKSDATEDSLRAVLKDNRFGAGLKDAEFVISSARVSCDRLNIILLKSIDE